MLKDRVKTALKAENIEIKDFEKTAEIYKGQFVRKMNSLENQFNSVKSIVEKAGGTIEITFPNEIQDHKTGEGNILTSRTEVEEALKDGIDSVSGLLIDTVVQRVQNNK